MKIRTGDYVRIMSGKDKGKEGKILQVFPSIERVVVEGANLMTKHLKKRGNTPGQKIQFPSPVHVSNVQMLSAQSKVPGRIGYKEIEKDGVKKKIRVLRRKALVEDIG